MEANTGTTDGKAGWSTTQKLLVGGIAAVVILGGAYIGYTKFYKKPEPGKDGALPGAGEQGGSENNSATTEIKTSGGGSVETTAPKSQPGNTGIGGGGTTNSTKGGGSGGAGGGGKSSGTSDSEGVVRKDFDGAWNYQLRNGVWFTAKKSNPGKWTSLAQNKIASDRLFAKYPKG